MRTALILMLTLIASKLTAQSVSGTVLDKFTKNGVTNAILTGGKSSTVTTTSGHFTLNNIKQSDTILITCRGYKPARVVLTSKILSDTLKIEIEQVSVVLREVNIRANRDYKKDSLRTRQEFAAIYNYQKPSIKNAFTTINPYAYTPSSHNVAENNTTAIVNVNLLSVLSLINTNKNQTSKLQQTLIKNEEYDYIYRVFSKQTVAAITSLKGDSLQIFMDKYRPDIKQARKMSTYEMTEYIKKSYVIFKTSSK